MRKSFDNLISFGLLACLVVSLVIVLTGCGFFNQAPEAKISTNPSSQNGTVSVEIGQTVDFDASNSSDPDGSIDSFNWDFGDGNSDTGQQVSHTYSSEGTFTAQLTVTDDGGETDTDTVEVEVSQQNGLSASFTVSSSSVMVGEEVTFDASNSSGNIDSYQWDFKSVSNPGTATATGETTSHTYDSVASYTVKLTVSDGGGGTDSTKSAAVSVSSQTDQPPTASFTTVPDDQGTGTVNVQVGKQIEFKASSSSDPDGTIQSYEWDFKHDSNPGTTTDTGETANYTYTDGGKYNVTLTVTDDDGLVATSSVKVHVNPPEPPPHP